MNRPPCSSVQTLLETEIVPFALAILMSNATASTKCNGLFIAQIWSLCLVHTVLQIINLVVM